ncbi:hypothetical protein TZ03_18425 [Pseudomonas sp. 10-1B]|nr:hypothetical protein TZ03_18425 [Pseudomonas sp. 10-1B]
MNQTTRPAIGIHHLQCIQMLVPTKHLQPRILVGAALRRERAAQQPQILSFAAKNAGAALRPYRDTRPLPQIQRKAQSLW